MLELLIVCRVLHDDRLAQLGSGLSLKQHPALLEVEVEVVRWSDQ
jgi:hypothetical protein